MLEFVELERNMLDQELISELDRRGLRPANSEEFWSGLKELPTDAHPVQAVILEGKRGDVLQWCYIDVANMYLRRFAIGFVNVGLCVAAIKK